MKSNQNHSESRPLGREQCYICWTSYNPDPPPQSCSLDELTERHHEFLRELESRGQLFGSGSLQDENGKRYGAGLYIITANTVTEAELIAAREPLTQAGIRTVKVTPWRRTGGSINLKINFAKGLLEAGERSFELKPLN